MNVTHASSRSTNQFTGVDNVAGEAGIFYPIAASTDPVNWGVPNLMFSTFSSRALRCRRPAHGQAADRRILVVAPLRRHQIRIGADYRTDASTGEANPNARGSYVLPASIHRPVREVAGMSGADFATFYLALRNRPRCRWEGPRVSARTRSTPTLKTTGDGMRGSP